MQYSSYWSSSYITIEEFKIRKALYIQTDAIIEVHDETDSHFKLGYIQFSDWTGHEKTRLSGGAKKYNHVATGPMDVNSEIP